MTSGMFETKENKKGGFMAKTRKEAKIIGSCSQEKGLVTSRNPEKCQRCVREDLPESETPKRKPRYFLKTSEKILFENGI